MTREPWETMDNCGCSLCRSIGEAEVRNLASARNGAHLKLAASLCGEGEAAMRLTGDPAFSFSGAATPG